MRISIVYFSLSSRTKTLSEYIAEYLKSRQLDADTFRLETSETGSFFKNCSDAFRKRKVKLRSMPEIGDSGIIFLGSPVWAFDITPAMRTFIDNSDLRGKKVFPFITYGSGKGKERAMRNFVRLVEDRGGIVIGTGESTGRKVKEEFPLFKERMEQCLEKYQLTKRRGQ